METVNNKDPTIGLIPKPINEPINENICNIRKIENVFFTLSDTGYNVPSNIIINFEANNEYNVINAGKWKVPTIIAPMAK